MAWGVAWGPVGGQAMWRRGLGRTEVRERSAPLSPRLSPAAQMIISDLSAPEERPAALSRLGLCLGSSTILGSLIGGGLSAAYG